MLSGSKSLLLGADIARLVVAIEHKSAVFEVTVLEGSNRIGGRIYTLHDQFTLGLYEEAGAMRIPS